MTAKPMHERFMTFFSRNGHNHDGVNSTPVAIALSSIGFQHLNDELRALISSLSQGRSGMTLVPGLSITTEAVAPGGFVTGTVDWVNLAVVRYTRIIMSSDTECILTFYHDDTYDEESREFRAIECGNDFLWEGVWAHFDETQTKKISYKVENTGNITSSFTLQLKSASYVPEV